MDGSPTVHSTMKTESDQPLTIVTPTTYAMQEVLNEWVTPSLRVDVGDTVAFTRTNYHNVQQVNDAGAVVAGGITSGAASIGGTFSHTFTEVGIYRFARRRRRRWSAR